MRADLVDPLQPFFFLACRFFLPSPRNVFFGYMLFTYIVSHWRIHLKYLAVLPKEHHWWCHKKYYSSRAEAFFAFSSNKSKLLIKFWMCQFFNTQHQEVGRRIFREITNVQGSSPAQLDWPFISLLALQNSVSTAACTNRQYSNAMSLERANPTISSSKHSVSFKRNKQVTGSTKSLLWSVPHWTQCLWGILFKIATSCSRM